MGMMTPRERVLAALNHREPDRVPVDIGQSAVTGISQFAYKNLLKTLDKADRKVRIFDIVQQLAEVDEDILEIFGVDMRGVYFGNPKGWMLNIEENGDYTTFKDVWDVEWRMPKSNGFYYDLWRHPLRGDNPDDIDGIKVMDPVDPDRSKPLIENAKRLREENKYFTLIGQCAYTVGFLQQMQWLQGFEDSYINIGCNPYFTDKLLDRLENLENRFWDDFLPQAGEYLDMIIMADDYAGQTSFLIAPEAFRKHFKPRYVRLFSKIKKAAPHIKVFFHCCGAMYDIIPDFIEMGVDVLNPLQFTASGMDMRKIKREFGKDLSFWGGGIDTQNTLPMGTPEQVRDEVRRNLDVLMPGGGFVFNTVHDIQADVPAENILAMVEAIHEFGVYR
jgi:uroporphyrinogen decarboxylase